MTHYAFILGVCEEWPEQRCDLGDIGIAKCLKYHCNIPNDNIVEIYDEEATKSNILQAFESLLDRRNDRLQNDEGEDDVLLFYYGGHGKIDAFCTSRQGNEPWIKHLDIINLLEEKFKGGTFVGIIDTCHSGGFGQAVLHKYHTSNKSLNVNYACIMSVPPSDVAGMEWTMGECFIKAFKGELSCYSSDDINNYDIDPIYLSTKKGKHPIKERAVTDMVPSNNNSDKRTYHPSWKQVIEYLSDEMARIKPDRLTTLFLGDRMKQFLDQPCIFGDNICSSVLSSCATASIPRNESWIFPFRREHHAVNDSVYVKMTGHSNVVNAENRLGWFPGQIISIHDNSEYSVELYDVISKKNWTVIVPLKQTSSSSRSTILCSLPFKVRNPLACANVITNLANKLAYYDITVPSGIKVKALWKDGEYYKATTISRHEVSWKEVDLSIDMKGPCVPVRFEEDGIISFVSTSSCRLMKDEKEISLADKSTFESADITTSMDAMMASFVLQGKKLHGDKPLLSSADEDTAINWEAYDIESASWESVQLMNKVDPSILPIKVIAYHMCYGRAESFSVVYWESDSTMSIVPNSCLRQRAKTDDDDDSSNEDNSSSSSSDGEEENHSSDFYKAREYILNSRKEQFNQPEQLSNRISSLHLTQALESLLS